MGGRENYCGSAGSFFIEPVHMQANLQFSIARETFNEVELHIKNELWNTSLDTIKTPGLATFSVSIFWISIELIGI